MSLKMRIALLLLALCAAGLLVTPSYPCTQPGTTTLLQSWLGSQLVGYINNNVPSASTSSAITIGIQRYRLKALAPPSLFQAVRKL